MRVHGWIAAVAGLVCLAALPLLAGCRGYREREADRPYSSGLARVERVDAAGSTGPGTQARVMAIGFLPDGCTAIDRIDRDGFGSRIDLTIVTRRPAGATCAPAPVPFQRSILIHTADLPPGLYTITVNGVSATIDVYAPLP